MAVYWLFRNRAFEPEAITMMTGVYNGVCQALKLDGADAREVDAVAKKVIEFAQRGERDPARLRDSVLEALRSDPPDRSKSL